MNFICLFDTKNSFLTSFWFIGDRHLRRTLQGLEKSRTAILLYKCATQLVFNSYSAVRYPKNVFFVCKFILIE